MRAITSDNATRCEAAFMDANKFLRQYIEGQRDFRSLDLSGLNFAKADLHDIDFAGVNLNAANLPAGPLRNHNLDPANCLGI